MVQHSHGTAKMRRHGMFVMPVAAFPCAGACIFSPPMTGEHQMQVLAGKQEP
jgi:hypothetical protein